MYIKFISEESLDCEIYIDVWLITTLLLIKEKCTTNESLQYIITNYDMAQLKSIKYNCVHNLI